MKLRRQGAVVWSAARMCCRVADGPDSEDNRVAGPHHCDQLASVLVSHYPKLDATAT